MSVHCRTGSLESWPSTILLVLFVHCRTGSLETSAAVSIFPTQVHCRTGSLEKNALRWEARVRAPAEPRLWFHARPVSLHSHLHWGQIDRGEALQP